MFPNSRQRSQANGAPNYLDLISRPSSLARMTDPGAIGPTFHTPTQADFREIYAARGTDGGSDGTRAFPADPANTDPVTGTAPARCTIASLQFNADGSAIYFTIGALFIAQATGTPLSWGDQVTIVAPPRLRAVMEGELEAAGRALAVEPKRST